MEPIWKYLIDNDFGLRIMVYSGNDDSVCGTLGTQSWLWNLGYGTQAGGWQQWFIDTTLNGRQAAGYYVEFHHNGGPQGKALVFVTVGSAGHQVPWFKSHKSFEMFKRYMQGDFGV